MNRARRLAAAWLVLGAAACGPGLRSTPTEPTACTSVAGSYVSSYGNSCPRFSNGDAATVTQKGCDIAVTVSGVGALTGTIVDSTVTWTVAFPGDCTGTGTGTGKIAGKLITGAYSGFQTGTSCCAASVAGTFTLSAM